MKDAAAANAPSRIALLGCGAISELCHGPAIQHLEEKGIATLVAVFDPDASRMAKLCALFPSAVSYRDESFLQTVPLDLVIVASPVSSHEAHVVRALEAGIGVLCEKPLAGDTDAGDRMIAAARQHQQILAVGLMRRFYSNVQFTRQLIKNKTLGPVISFSVQEGGPFNWPARSDSLFRKGTAGGGVLLDVGVHVLDLVVNWFGEPQKMTYTDDAMGGIEANCRLELSYASGFNGTIQLSRDWDTASRYVIEFERGTLRLRAGEAEKVQLELKDAGFSLESPLKKQAAFATSTAASFQQAFLAQLQNVIAAVRGNSQPLVPADEGIRSLRLIEQCYQNRSLMEMPWLSPEERKASGLLATGGTR
jgi:predicted dehydrogenase